MKNNEELIEELQERANKELLSDNIFTNALSRIKELERDLSQVYNKCRCNVKDKCKMCAHYDDCHK